MHPKQLIGLGKFVNNSIKDIDLYSTLIFGANYFYRGVNRRLTQSKGNIKPDVLGIDITNHCSKKCIGCYVPREIKEDKKVIDKSLLLSAIYQAKKLRIRNFVFFWVGNL